MGIPFNLRKFGEEFLVFVFLAHVDLEGHVICEQERGDVFIRFKKSVQLVAPAAPFAADIEKNILARFLCDSYSFLKLDGRVGLRIVFDFVEWRLALLTKHAERKENKNSKDNK